MIKEDSHRPLLKRHYNLIVLGIVLLSFALRVYRLDYQSLRGDEGATYLYIIRSLGELLNLLGISDPHPPVYYISMQAWMILAGDTEFALRFPSVVTGVLLVASTAALGRIMLDVRLGLLAALLIAISPYHVFYAQDARSYPLVTLLGLLSTLILWWALRERRWRYWILYGLVTLVAMYTHYYASFIAIFQALFVLEDGWRRRRFPWQYAIVGAVDCLLFLPWILFSWRMLAGYKGMGETTGIVGSIFRPLMAFAGGQLLTSQTGWIITFLAVCLACLGTVSLWRRHQRAALLLALYLSAPLMGVYLASQFRPIFNERYLMLASPAFYLLAGAGLVWLLSIRRVWITIGSLLLATVLLATTGLALSNYYFNLEFAKSPPWRDVLGYVARKARAGDALIYTAPLPTILYYNHERLPAYLVPYEPETTLPEAVQDLENILNDHPRVWLVPAESDRQVSYQVEPWLDRHSVRLDQTFFRIIHIGLYESPAAFWDAMTPQETHFADDSLRMMGFRLADEKAPLVVEAGESIPLTLVWYAQRPPQTAYTVFTHLVGPDGNLWGQWDNPPVWGSYPTTEWEAGEMVFDQYLIPVKEDAPPGEYRMLVGLYDPTTGARLPVLDDNKQILGDSIRLSQTIVVSEPGR